MEIDLPLLTGGGVTLLGAGWFIKVLADRFVSKAHNAEDAKESAITSALKEIAASMDTLKTGMADLKADVRLVTADQHHQRGEGSKIVERMDGISENHGDRLASLEQRVTILETQAKAKVKR